AEDVQRRLVEEERMEAGGGFGIGRAVPRFHAMVTADRDAPRSVGWWAVQLLGEEVAPARDALCEQRAGDERVRREEERQSLAAGVDPDADESSEQAAVQRQAAVGREHDRGQVLA